MKKTRKFEGKTFNLFSKVKSKSHANEIKLRSKKRGIGTSLNVRVVKGRDENGKVVYGLYRRYK
tara:strand:- start:1399 stop:1590 length:192 start_codon:yes stop_codon:yes gene_type:complete